MKKITIRYENGIMQELIDNDESDFNEYCNGKDEIFSCSNIIQISTTKSCLLLRPSKIVSINIENIETEESLKEDY